MTCPHCHGRSANDRCLNCGAHLPPCNDLPRDPIERIVATGLRAAGIPYITDGGGANPTGLDFGLANGIQIEVKQFHSPRIAGQMARATDVIAIQGRRAAEWFAGILSNRALDDLKPALVEALAELIYLREYGAQGARWEANESKDVWRARARAALGTE